MSRRVKRIYIYIKSAFEMIFKLRENQNICTHCSVDDKEGRLRDGARIKHEELTDVFKEVTLHARAEILLSSAQVLVEKSKG